MKLRGEESAAEHDSSPGSQEPLRPGGLLQAAREKVNTDTQSLQSGLK